MCLIRKNSWYLLIVENTQHVSLRMVHRALARDVIHDVPDGRRHVGGILFAPRGKC
jgi:hypothetical protein